MRLPEFIVKLSPIGETLAALDAETARLEAETAARNSQLAVSTADTGLALWEADYGLLSAGDLTVRRGRVRAALTGRSVTRLVITGRVTLMEEGEWSG